MTVEVFDEVMTPFDFDIDEVSRLVVDGTLQTEEFPKEAFVSITLVSEEEIRDINREQRGIDSATDVLSFPMIDWKKPVDYEKLDEALDIYEPDSGEVVLGDVILCVPRVISQAKEYGHSIKREFAFLICHSMLHLLGYDHMEESDRILMEEHQNKIMNFINITREA